MLVLVCGPAPDGDLRAARRDVLEGIERLLPHASAAGVRLGIEPLHPMMIAERSVVVTLAQANDMAERFDPAAVGVVVDAYHVWWDPDLERELDRGRRERILGYHVSDWLSPTPDVLAGRGMMGDGVIELRRPARPGRGGGLPGADRGRGDQRGAAGAARRRAGGAGGRALPQLRLAVVERGTTACGSSVSGGPSAPSPTIRRAATAPNS